MIKSLFKCMYSHRLLVVGMILAPKSRCSVPGSFEDETLLICIIYIQEKVHQSIPKANTGLECIYCCPCASLCDHSDIFLLQYMSPSFFSNFLLLRPNVSLLQISSTCPSLFCLFQRFPSSPPRTNFCPSPNSFLFFLFPLLLAPPGTLEAIPAYY